MDKFQAIEVMCATLHSSYHHAFGKECCTAVISDTPGTMRTKVKLRSIAHKEGKTLWKLMQDVKEQYTEVDRWLDACDAYDEGRVSVMPKLPDIKTFEALCGDVDVKMLVPGACFQFARPYWMCDNKMLEHTMMHNCAYDGNTVISMTPQSSRYNGLAYMSPVGALSYSPSREGVIANSSVDTLVRRAEKRADRFLNGLVAATVAFRKAEDTLPKTPFDLYDFSARQMASVLQTARNMQLDGKWCNGAKPCVPSDTKGWYLFQVRSTEVCTCTVRVPKHPYIDARIVSKKDMFVTGFGGASKDEIVDRLRKVRNALYEESRTLNFNLIALTDEAVAAIRGMDDIYKTWFDIVDMERLENVQAKYDAEAAEARKEARKNVVRATKSEPARLIDGYPGMSGKGMTLCPPRSLEQVDSLAKMSDIRVKGKAFCDTLVVSRTIVDETLSARIQASAAPDGEQGFERLLRMLLTSMDARRTAGIQYVYVVPAKHLPDAAGLTKAVTIGKLAAELPERIQAVFAHNNMRIIHPCVFTYLRGLLGLRQMTEEALSSDLRWHFGAEADSIPLGMRDKGRTVDGLFGSIENAFKVYYTAVDLLDKIGVASPPFFRFNDWLVETIPGKPEPTGRDVEAAVLHCGMRGMPAMYKDGATAALNARAAKADALLVKSIRSAVMKYSVPLDLKKVHRDMKKWSMNRDKEIDQVIEKSKRSDKH